MTFCSCFIHVYLFILLDHLLIYMCLFFDNDIQLVEGNVAQFGVLNESASDSQQCSFSDLFISMCILC